jgi:hypothetical protein
MYACGLFGYHDPLPEWGIELIKGVEKETPTLD